MKAKLLGVLILLAVLVPVLTSIVSAQGPNPTPPTARGGAQPVLGEPRVVQGYNPSPNFSSPPDFDTSRRPVQAPTTVPKAGVRAPSTLGQPGFSLRYLQSFGMVEVPYFDDSTHLNQPYGVGTDGTNVWIADSYNLRALKFSSGGTFLQEIGKAGFRYGVPNISLDWVTDVAVDAGGNIWLADGDVNQVFMFNSSGSYLKALGQSWTSGTANNLFNRPRDIAFDSGGNIYVSDGNNHRIQIFTSSLVYSATIGTSGVSGNSNTQFNNPRHVAIYADNLYVADCSNHRVQVFDASHNYVATIGVTSVSGSDNSHFNCPNGVAVDSNHIYVADDNNQRVQIFDRVTRAYQNTLGTGVQGTGNNEFIYPADVSVDGGGNIYVADTFNFRVQEYDSSLTFVRSYGTTGSPGVSYVTDNSHFNQPSGIVIAPDGSVYFTEARGHRLLKLNPAGVVQWTIGIAGIPCTGTYCFSYPNGVALDSSGNVYVADSSNNRVQIYTSGGTYIATIGGTYGTGTYQFNYPMGVAIDTANNIYVADTNNQRIQIYNSSRIYVNTIGTGVAGSTNSQLNSPQDVAVKLGNIYVADRNNHRVQVFNNSLAYARTIGTGTCGSDFATLCNPIAIAVDAVGRTYVADQWGYRIMVFDNTGAFLTTIGNSGGSRTGQMHQVEGIGFDSQGNLYYADLLNHRLEKLAMGVPGWLQTNINGFGDSQNRYATTLAPFGGMLYAGLYNTSGNGAQIWRMSSNGTWASVITNGFGITRNIAIDYLFTFNTQLYASTWADAVNGGEVYRSPDGNTWNKVVSSGFGDPTNGEVFRLGSFNNQIYAGTWSYTNTHGAEIWRSSTGDNLSWSRVVSNGLGDANNQAVLSFETFSGYLYAGNYNTSTGATVWRTSDGATWNPVSSGGFGNINNFEMSSLSSFNGYLYASTTYLNVGLAGAQVWRCQVCDGTDWGKVVDNGFGNTNARGSTALVPLNGYLFLVMGNGATGMEVWRTQDGVNWAQVGYAGFGNSNNAAPYFGNNSTAWGNTLYVGPTNGANGAQVWRMLDQLYFLPLILR